MAPKFRGGSDEWLDNEEPRAGGKKSGARKDPPPLAPEEANATVAEVYPSLCMARLDDGTRLLCNYRRAAVIGSRVAGFRPKGAIARREKSPVAVGDRIRAEAAPGIGNGWVTGICQRTSELIRSVPERADHYVHVVVANLDLLVIVSAARNPDFSAGLIDRFMVAAAAGGIPVVLVVNKVDLLTEAARAHPPWEVYRGIGVEIVEVSAKQSIGLEALRQRLHSHRAAFCGHSGVGKTSLLRELLGRDIGRVGEVSESTGKGRHTTTGAVLLETPGGEGWIDTPGIREFGLLGVEPEELIRFFPEIAAVTGCAQAGCTHTGEAGCAAVGLPRYPSFFRLRESLLERERSASL